jgi:hypothetical protein
MTKGSLNYSPPWLRWRLLKPSEQTITGPPWSTAMLSAKPRASSWARYKINSGAAFSTLTRISQGQNVKLHQVARQIVETGKLPDTAER